MKKTKIASLLAITVLLFVSSCEKWKDQPAQNLGLSNKYCNVPTAINYNVGFPGIEDNSTCIYPSTPFVGNYSFRDSIYNNANELVIGDSIHFTITVRDSCRFSLQNFCSNVNSLKFTANRYYRAEADSIIGAGTQLMCRIQDTLSGRMEYRNTDSSLYLEWAIVSDTATNWHKGRAYKK
jgi:hypothetical protein